MLSFERIAKLFEKLKRHVTDDSCMDHTEYDSPAELRAVVDGWLHVLQGKSVVGLPYDINGFMPFYEHSKSNGWSDDFRDFFEQYMRWYNIEDFPAS